MIGDAEILFEMIMTEHFCRILFRSQGVLVQAIGPSEFTICHYDK